MLPRRSPLGINFLVGTRNPTALGVKAYMPSCLHKTASMKLRASLLITQDQPHPVYLNIIPKAVPGVHVGLKDIEGPAIFSI